MANISEILQGIKNGAAGAEEAAAAEAEAVDDAAVDAEIEEALALAEEEPIDDEIAAEEEAVTEEAAAAEEAPPADEGAAEAEAAAEEDIAADEAEANPGATFDVDSYINNLTLGSGVAAADGEEVLDEEVASEEAAAQTYTTDQVRELVSKAVNDAITQYQETVAPAIENEPEATQEEMVAAFNAFLAEGDINEQITDDVISGMVDYMTSKGTSMNDPRAYAEAYHATAPRQVSIEDVPQEVRDAIIAEAAAGQAAANQGLPPVVTSAQQGAPAIPPTQIKGNIMERAAAIKQANGAV